MPEESPIVTMLRDKIVPRIVYARKIRRKPTYIAYEVYSYVLDIGTFLLALGLLAPFQASLAAIKNQSTDVHHLSLAFWIILGIGIFWAGLNVFFNRTKVAQCHAFADALTARIAARQEDLHTALESLDPRPKLEEWRNDINVYSFGDPTLAMNYPQVVEQCKDDIDKETARLVATYQQHWQQFPKLPDREPKEGGHNDG